MGIIYDKEAKEKKLYKAYDMTVYGKEMTYNWSIYPDKPDELCVTSLRITKGNEDVFKTELGNNCIFKDNFDRTIDNFLYYIEKDKPDTFNIEQTMFKTLAQSNSIFNHRMEQRKKAEQKVTDEQERMRKIDEEYQNKIDYIKRKASQHGWLAYINKIFDKCVIFKAKRKLGKEFLEEHIAKDGEKEMERIVEFINNYPENPDASIIFKGSIDRAVEYFGGGK